MAMQLDSPRPQAHRPAHRRARRRRRRWLLRVAVVIVSALTLVAGFFSVLFVTTPSVRNAPTLVAGILAAHHDPSDHGVVPSKVAAALLATEDSRFYSDPAVDLQGTVRAMWGLVTQNPNLGGATLEVQLAKLLYTPDQSAPLALAKQVVLAVKLDQAFTKHQILAMYLDAVYFGDGAYGITAAAQHYFGRSPEALSWAQATLLAGLVQAPTAYNPHHHLHLALLRRDHVLERMVAVGDLTPAQVAAVRTQPLDPAIPFSG
ncbi:MAG TPA: biosynthetic peptidoglycan transglycosylase [Acidimicrobiales bacterium]|nr:biosynthetic peptidoglycan transglycosylase [Acidimicrobiales bacterium]